MNGCSTCRGTCLKAWQPVFNPQSPCKSGRRAPTHEQNFKRIILSEQGRRANFANTFPRGNFSNVYELSPHLLLFKTPLELNYQGVTFFEGELLLWCLASGAWIPTSLSPRGSSQDCSLQSRQVQLSLTLYRAQVENGWVGVAGMGSLTYLGASFLTLLEYGAEETGWCVELIRC